VSVEMPQHPSGGGPEADPLPSLREVLLAEKVIRRYLSPTPLVWSRRLSREIGADVRVKLENLNPTNSFKVRGGVYLMSVLAEEGVRGSSPPPWATTPSPSPMPVPSSAYPSRS
jgi:threonine dehydratase